MFTVIKATIGLTLLLSALLMLTLALAKNSWLAAVYFAVAACGVMNLFLDQDEL